MISSTEQYQELGVKVSDRFLFPGSSCFPLSPCNKPKKIIDKNNMIAKND